MKSDCINNTPDLSLGRSRSNMTNGESVPRLRRIASHCDSAIEAERRRKALHKTPDDPVHTVADSLFSSSSGFRDFRGILNWCLILLVLATGRAALENILKYGILIDPVSWLGVFLTDPYSWPSFCLLLAINPFILLPLYIERQLACGNVSERLGHILYTGLLMSELIFPALVVLQVHPNPVTSSPVLALYVVVFLKLVSYSQVNRWCRRHRSTNKKARSRTPSASNISDLCMDRKINEEQVYPQNLNFYDLYYFMFAPTLCYELNFPRTTRIRKAFIAKRLIEMVFLYGLILSLIQQWIIPTVNNSLVPFQQLNFLGLVERLLKLAVPNHFIWLIFFYWLFHSCLNLTAELLTFGDRVFYRDWWNAESVNVFWQKWNVPVHRWAFRHLYKPLLVKKFSKLQASVAVFFVSAFFHEYLVSIPLHMFRLWSFIGLLAQIPLMLMPGVLGEKGGNLVVWLSLIIGQPIAILMYYHDYYVLHQI